MPLPTAARISRCLTCGARPHVAAHRKQHGAPKMAHNSAVMREASGLWPAALRSKCAGHRAHMRAGREVAPPCAAAPWPACKNFVFDFKIRDLIQLWHNNVLKDPSLGSDTTVGTCVTLNGSGIQLAVGPQPLRLRNHNFGLAQRIMVKRLATSRHDPLGITDSACKNQLVVVSVQYGPFNTYIPIRSTTIGKSRVARDPIAMHTSWRSNSDIASVTRVSRTFRVVGTNQYNQDLGLIHSTNGNHLESPKEGSSIDHQVTIYLHAQNITMFPTNETRYFASQILVSISGGLSLSLTANRLGTSSEYTVTIRYVS
ncbi:hypothetical protein F511_35570 [Dorcoceras hygrometricum]|uniref:Uncharacterized protein n=1 Tax=Dorcoceras hygrometricum TaxID=472368 RepID=A0A2Z7ASA6_9LAMI|nr:hypothetical protein F511_35570 [Dorcoceras hygrometricum]